MNEYSTSSTLYDQLILTRLIENSTFTLSNTSYYQHQNNSYSIHMIQLTKK